MPTSRGEQPALRGVGAARGTQGQASDVASNLRLPQELSWQWQQIPEDVRPVRILQARKDSLTAAVTEGGWQVTESLANSARIRGKSFKATKRAYMMCL